MPPRRRSLASCPGDPSLPVSDCRRLPLGPRHYLTEYPEGVRALVVFGDFRDTAREKGRTTAVTDLHALAAHEHWHRRTSHEWACYVWRPDLTEATSGELLALRPTSIGCWSGSIVTICFRRSGCALHVELEVLEISRTEFSVRVLSEKQVQGVARELVLAGSAQAYGTVKLMDVIYGVGSAHAQDTARALLSPRPPPTPRRHEATGERLHAAGRGQGQASTTPRQSVRASSAPRPTTSAAPMKQANVFQDAIPPQKRLCGRSGYRALSSPNSQLSTQASTPRSGRKFHGSGQPSWPPSPLMAG